MVAGIVIRGATYARWRHQLQARQLPMLRCEIIRCYLDLRSSVPRVFNRILFSNPSPCRERVFRGCISTRRTSNPHFPLNTHRLAQQMTSSPISDALILSPRAPRAIIPPDDNSRREGRWAVFLNAYPPPGRTLGRAYTALGRAVETQANRTAYSLGLGPHVVSGKIKSHFGNGEQRVQQLELLRNSIPHKLEEHCRRLMKYTLPYALSICCYSYIQPCNALYSTEAANTQYQAFEDVVDLVTLFPGLRIHFLGAKCMDNVTSTDAISALWDRSTGVSGVLIDHGMVD
jgi:hypothetical protein